VHSLYRSLLLPHRFVHARPLVSVAGGERSVTNLQPIEGNASYLWCIIVLQASTMERESTSIRGPRMG
jgi:hypothetical protein